jgi:glucose dehydrogenase
LVKRKIAVLAGGVLGLLVAYRGGNWWALAAPTTTKSVDAQVYGGQAAGDRYSALKQINRKNINKLKVAWTYNTGDTAGGIQTQPLIVDRRMFVYSATQKVAALGAGMVVDEKRGIVYAPTGSAVSDFYGADRAGNDLYANTLLAPRWQHGQADLVLSGSIPGVIADSGGPDAQARP